MRESSDHAASEKEAALAGGSAVRASSQYTKAAGSIRGQGAYETNQRMHE